MYSGKKMYQLLMKHLFIMQNNILLSPDLLNLMTKNQSHIIIQLKNLSYYGSNNKSNKSVIWF